MLFVGIVWFIVERDGVYEEFDFLFCGSGNRGSLVNVFRGVYWLRGVFILFLRVELELIFGRGLIFVLIFVCGV